MLLRIIKRKFRHSKKAAFPLKTAVLLILLLWGIYELVQSRILTPIACRQIEQLTGGQVNIGDVKLQFNGIVVVKNLEIGSCLDQSRAGAIITAGKVEAAFSRISFFKLKPRLKSLTVKDFVVNAQYDTERKNWNFSALQMKGAGTYENDLPVIHLERGTIKISKKTQDTSEKICDIPVFVGFIARVGRKNDYGFSIQTHKKNEIGYSRIGGKWARGAESSINMTAEQVSSATFPIFSNAWDMTDVVLNLKYDENTISIEEFTATVGGDTDIEITGSVTDYRNKAQYRIETHIRNLMLSNEPRSNSLVYGAGLLEKLGPKLRNFLQLYHPTGRVDLDVTAVGSFGRLWESKWSGNIKCKDVTVLYTRFPYRLTSMTGDIRLNETGVFLDNLQCRHENVDLTINGHTKTTDQGTGFDMTITSPNMSLDDGLYKALNTKQQLLWFTFTPAGTAKINYRIWRKPGEEKQSYLTIDLVDAQAVYQHFPYQLKNLKGNVVIEPGKITINKLLADYEGSQIVLNGSVTEINTEKPRYNIIIDAKDIPVDSRLMAALPARQRQFYELFSTDATTDVSIEVFPNETGKRLVDYRATVSIEGAAITYEKFPVPLTDVKVDAVVTKEVTVLRKLVGRNGNGEVSISGKVWPTSEDDSEPSFCLSVEARELELKGKWLDSLPDEAKKFMSAFRPTGKINVHANLSKNPKVGDYCSGNKVVIDCIDIDLNPRAFAFPIENVMGKITITDEKILLQNIRTQNLTQATSDPNEIESITVNGTILRDSDNLHNGNLTVRARNVLIDERFQKAFAQVNLLSHGKFTLQGYADIDIKKLKFYTDNKLDKWVDIDGSVSLKQFNTGNTGILKNLDATLTARALYRIGHGLVQSSGRLEANTFTIMDRLVNNLNANLIYDPGKGTISSNNFAADSYGGKIIGNCQLTPLPNKGVEYILESLFCNIDLNGILAAGNSPESDSNAYSHGLIDGSIGISGILGKKESRIGRMSIGIRDMAFARRSLLGKLVTAAQLDDPTDFIFNEIKVESYLKSNTIDLEEVRMVGPSTVLLGSGKIDTQNRKIDLRLTAYGKDATSKPSFFETLARGLGSAVIQVDIKGDIENPDIDPTTLPVIQKPFEIFGTQR